MSRWHTTDFDLLPEQAFRPRGGRFGKFSGGMTMEGGGKGDGPEPDPAIGQASLRQIALAEKQWDEYVKEGGDRDWLRGITEESLGIQRNSAAKAGELSDYQLASMKFNDDRYRDVAIPYEDQLLEDVKRFDSQEYKDQQIGLALADTNAAFTNARAQADRGLTRMGVNPTSGAFLDSSNKNSIAQAAALSSAANKTRQAADQIGLSTKMQMYGGMKGLSGLGATNAGLATSAMGTGLNAAGGMNTSGAGFIGANNNTFGSSMNGMTAGISGANQFASNQIKSSESSGGDSFGSIFGGLGGLAAGGAKLYTAFGSDRRLKQDIELVGVDERTGLNLYEFSYKSNPSVRFQGVMADEAEKVMPEAVITTEDGYKAVIYAALGIEFKEVA